MKTLAIAMFPLVVMSVARLAMAAPESPQPNIGIDEKLGQTVPLDTMLVDEDGDRVSLRSLVDKPTLLTLNYFRCAGICTPLLNGVAYMLKTTHQVPGKDFQVITVSFDPRDTAEVAGRKKENYIKQLAPGFPPTAWRFLTGDPMSTKRLADAVGFKFAKRDEDYVHPTAIIVLSPAGMVTRYLYGLSFLPADVAMAVNEATHERTGPTIARLLRICYSYDPSGHRYSLDATRLSAVLTITLAIAFGVAIAVSRRTRRRSSPD